MGKVKKQRIQENTPRHNNKLPHTADVQQQKQACL
jgi:hypothetical protein